MARPTLLVAEREPGAALSVRKLVLETAKFNVITAHSSGEASELFSAAPKLIDALIISSDLKGVEGVIGQVKKSRRKVAVICISPNRLAHMKGADHQVSSHEPEALVNLCRELLGDPRSKK